MKKIVDLTPEHCLALLAHLSVCCVEMAPPKDSKDEEHIDEVKNALNEYVKIIITECGLDVNHFNECLDQVQEYIIYEVDDAENQKD